MNENIFSYITLCLNEDTLPHAFLIETNDVEKANNEIVDFLYKKQILKKESSENNLNLIVTEPDGKEIRAGEIDYLKTRFSTTPIIDKYNVYIIKEAEKMNISSSNKLLKFLEEPADFILGFLIVTKNSTILDTIKSRCQQFRLDYEEESKLSEHVIEIVKFLDNPNYQQELELRANLSELERPAIITIITDSLSILSNRLPKDSQFTITISSNILLLDNVLRLLKSNVNIDLALDKLFIEAR